MSIFVMSENFNWKPYYIGAAIVTIIACFVNIKVGAGLAIGSVFYFVNDWINLRKFPSLNNTGKAVGSMLLAMAVQGILVFAAGAISWILGDLPCFIACFVALILPSVYFFIVGSRK